MFRKFILRIIIVCLISPLCLGFKTSLSASVKEEGGVAGAYLYWGAGARALGMGRAFVGLCDDGSSPYWNPAGLGQIRKKQFSSLYSILWENTGYSFLSYVHPLFSYKSYKKGGLGVAIVNLTSTKFEKTDRYNVVLGNTFDTETTGIVSYGKEVFDGIYSGISLKIVNQTVDKYSDTGFGMDLGLLYKPKMGFWFVDNRLALGLNLQNIVSPEIKLKETKDRFPLNIKAGLSYRIIPDRFTFVVDANKSEKHSIKLSYGMEYMFNKGFSVRGGVNENEFTGGVGIGIKNFNIDYAYAYHNVLGRDLSLGSSHRIGLNVVFPKVVEVVKFVPECINMSVEFYPKRDKDFEKILQLYNVKDYRKIIKKGKKYCRKNKKKAYRYSVMFLMGESYFNQNRFKPALREYRKVVQSGFSKLVSYAKVRIAECLYNMGKYKHALDEFNKIIKEKGITDEQLVSELLFDIGMCYIRLNKFSDAYTSFQEIVYNLPNTVKKKESIYLMGLIDYMNKDYDSSLDYLKMLDNETIPETIRNKGVFYSGMILDKMGKQFLSLGRFKEVEGRFVEELFNEVCLYKIAEMFYRLGDYKIAQMRWNEFLDRYPESEYTPYVRFMIGLCYYNNGDYSLAKSCFNKFINEYSNKYFLRGVNKKGMYRIKKELIPASYYNIALNEEALGNKKEAINIHKWICKKYKNNKTEFLSMRRLTYLYFGDKKYQKTVDMVDSLIKKKRCPEDVLWLKALSLFHLGRYNESRMLCLDNISNSNDEKIKEKFMYLLGLVYMHTNQYEKIITSYYHLIKNREFNDKEILGMCYYNVAKAYYLLNDYKKAKDVFEYVLEEAPLSKVSTFSYIGMINALNRKKDFDAALKEDKKWLDLYSDMDDVKKIGLLAKADIYFNKKDYKKAIIDYDKFINFYNKDKRVVDAMYYKGVCLKRLGYYIDAISVWKELLELEINKKLREELLERIASIYFALGKYDKAVVWYRKITEEFSGSIQAKQAQMHIAESLYNQKKYTQAIKEYERLLGLNPDEKIKNATLDAIKICYFEKAKSTTTLEQGLKGFISKYSKERIVGEAYWQLAVDAYEHNQYGKAIGYFKKVIEDYPQVESAKPSFYYLGECYYLTKKYKEAKDVLEKFIKNYPKDRLFYQAKFYLASALFSLKRIDECIKHYNDILVTNPKGEIDISSRLNIALAYVVSKKLDKAAMQYKQFLKRYPSNKKKNFVYWQLGKIYQGLQQYRNAIRYYHKVKPQKGISYLEIKYRTGYCYEELGDLESADRIYSLLRKRRPKDDPFRLAGLIRLAQIYENNGEAWRAVYLYRDVARNSKNENWRKAAWMRIKALRKEFGVRP